MSTDGISLSITEDITSVTVEENVTTINIAPEVTTLEIKGISISNAGDASAMPYGGTGNTLGTGGNVAASLDHINTNGFNKNLDQTIDGNITFEEGHSITFPNQSPVEDVLNLNNNNITGVNHITFSDAGPNEGLIWENVRIYESPDDLTTNVPSGAGNFQVTYKQADSSYARRFTVKDTGVDVVGTITFDGGTTSENLNFESNARARFGDGQQLQIYSDGTTSYIDESGSGNLLIRGNNLHLQKYTGANYLTAVADGATTLFYNGNTTLATTSGGIDVTGTITFDGGTTSQNLNFGDGIKAVFGNESELQIYHDGFHSYIKDAGTGNLRIQAKDFQLVSSDNVDRYMIVADENGATALYYNGAPKLFTSENGLSITGRAVASEDFRADMFRSSTYSSSSYLDFDDDETRGSTNATTLESIAGMNLKFDNNASDGQSFRIFGNTDGTNTAAFTIDNNLNVGIGKEDPDTKLDVAGTIRSSEKMEAPLFKGDLEGAVHFKASGDNLAKGDVVYITGYQGQRTTVDKADASNSAKMPAFGIVNSVTGSNVDVLTFGSMFSLSTIGIATGTELYVSATTPGGYETSAPTGEGNLVQKIAKVVRGDSNSGSIKIMGAGRTNATPNLNDGNIFIGNSSNIPTTASFDTTFASSFATRTTDNLTEGSNEYYTDAKADARVNLQTGSNLDLSQKTTSDLSEGSNEYYTDAKVNTKLGSGVGNIVTSGYLRGPAEFTIDPAAHGDDTGTVVIAGNLQVDGTTTTINSTTLDVADLEITLASGAQTAAQAHGAGININAANAKVTFNATDNRWDVNRTLRSTGDIIALGDITGSDLTIADITSSGNFSTTGDVSVTGKFKDSSGSSGSSTQVLSSTGSGTSWVASSNILRILTDSSEDNTEFESLNLGTEKLTITGGTGISTNHGTVNTVSINLETVSGLTSGQYGGAGSIPQITVDTTGRVTAIGTVTGQAGPIGPEGATTFPYIFNNDTAWNSSNPSYRKLKSNESNLTNTTQWSVSYRMDDPADSGNEYIELQSFIQTVADGDDAPTSAIKGYLKVAEQSTPSNFVLYEITGGDNVGDSGGFTKMDVTYLAGTITSIANNEPVFVSFSRTGDAGDASSGSGGSVRTVKVDTDGNGTVDSTLSDSEDLTLKAGTNVTLGEQTGVVTINASGETNQNAFSSIAVESQNTVSADSTTDTLTLIAGSNISIATDDSTDSVTINASGGEITVQEEGTSLSTAATTLNFVGDGVTATGNGATKTITISGGGSGTAGLVQDADGDTKIQVEEAVDEDIIRFDIAGTESMTLNADALELKSTDLKLTASGTSSTITGGNTAHAWKDTEKVLDPQYLQEEVHTLHLSDDGNTLVFNTGTRNNDAYRLVKVELTTAFDIAGGVSSTSYDNVMDSIDSNTDVFDITFNNNGTKAYALTDHRPVTSGREYMIAYYEPSTSYGPALGTLVNRYFYSTSNDYIPRSFEFKTDGTKFFIAGFDRDNTEDFYVWQYSLSTAYDLSDLSSDTGTTRHADDPGSSDRVNITLLDPNIKSANALQFSSDGKVFYVLDTVNKAVKSFNMSTAWDITTASYVGVASLASKDRAPLALHVDTTNDIALVSGRFSELIFQYDVDNSEILSITDASTYTGSFSAGDVTVSGDISATGDISTNLLDTKRIKTTSSIETTSSLLVLKSGNAIPEETFSPGTSGILNATDNIVNGAPPHSIKLDDDHDIETLDRVRYIKADGDTEILSFDPDDIYYAVVTGRYVQFARTYDKANLTPPNVLDLSSSGTYSGSHTLKVLKEEVKIESSDIEIGGSSAEGSTISISNLGAPTDTLDTHYINFNDRSNAYPQAVINLGNQAITSGRQNINIGSEASAQTQNINVYGTFSVLSGATASRTITLGSATQTGTITLGQSTKNNTINIGNGATENGKEQIINIGTAGVSGSTTSINIGPLTLPASDGGANQVLKTDGNGNLSFVNQSGGSAITVQEEGASLTTAASTLNFVGAGATATESNGTVTVTIPGAEPPITGLMGSSGSQVTRNILTVSDSSGNTGSSSNLNYINIGDSNVTSPHVKLYGRANIKSNGSLNANVQGLKIENTDGGSAASFSMTNRLGEAELEAYYGNGSGSNISMHYGQNGEKFRFNANGRLGIGVTLPQQALHVSGNIIATGNVTAYYSDERLKDLKGPVPNALQKINQLTGYYYKPNDLAISLGVDNTDLEIGVSAQEVEKVLPEIVTKSAVGSTEFGEDYKSVWYDKLTPVLIEAVKELTEKITSLEERIKELEN